MNITAAGIPEVLNVAIPLLGVEHLISLPQSVKKFMLQVREGGDIRVGFASGDSFNKYFTVRGFSTYYEDMVQGPISLYVQSVTNNTTIEIVLWKHYD